MSEHGHGGGGHGNPEGGNKGKEGGWFKEAIDNFVNGPKEMVKKTLDPEEISKGMTEDLIWPVLGKMASGPVSGEGGGHGGGGHSKGHGGGGHH